MSDDDLRQLVLIEWTRHDWDKSPQHKPFRRLDVPTRQRLGNRIESLYGDMLDDALMPAVREALADAWDDGAEAAYEWQIGVTGKPDNPWREDD